MTTIKKTLFCALFISSLLASITSCKKDESSPTTPLPDPPVAFFSMSKTNGLAPCTVVFLNNSTNVTSYHWEFGDGGESDLEDVTYTFDNPGDYTITLYATGSGGTDSISNNIFVRNSLTGTWNKTLHISGYVFYGKLEIVHLENDQLTGTFVFNDGSGLTSLLSNSKINGYNVTIDWMLEEYHLSFKGIVNNNFGYMSGDYYADGDYVDVWNASKSYKNSTSIINVDSSNSQYASFSNLLNSSMNK